MSYATRPVVLDTESYYQALLKDIPAARARVCIGAMLLLTGKRLAPLFAALHEAVARGVAVTIFLDTGAVQSSFIHSVEKGTSRGQRLRQTYQELETMAGLGATIYAVGKRGLQPFKGRCHIKLAVIDDICYSFGGVNLRDESLPYSDFMVRVNDSQTANQLLRLVKRIGQQGTTIKDFSRNCAAGTILFDGGEPGHSIIYERACELTAQASKVYYVSQMAPSGQLGHLLHETNALCYFNRPEQNPLALHAWGQAFDQQRYRSTNNYTGTDYIHAKFMLFELASGKRVALTGSHNFSYRGIAFGTQEIALHSTDTALWDQLFTYLKTTIIGAKG